MCSADDYKNKVIEMFGESINEIPPDNKTEPFEGTEMNGGEKLHRMTYITDTEEQMLQKLKKSVDQVISIYNEKRHVHNGILTIPNIRYLINCDMVTEVFEKKLYDLGYRHCRSFQGTNEYTDYKQYRIVKIPDSLREPLKEFLSSMEFDDCKYDNHGYFIGDALRNEFNITDRFLMYEIVEQYRDIIKWRE
jgi:hypothetical protein